jgi:hypothetical protein
VWKGKKANEQEKKGAMSQALVGTGVRKEDQSNEALAQTRAQHRKRPGKILGGLAGSQPDPVVGSLRGHSVSPREGSLLPENLTPGNPGPLWDVGCHLPMLQLSLEKGGGHGGWSFYKRGLG